MTDAPAARLQKAAAVGGFRSLADNAVDWVRQGKTTLQEVDRVIGSAGAELEKTGYSVTEAVNGIAALAQVRQTVATAGLLVLVLTGSSSEDTEAQLMDEGADDYIRKPLEPARFVARVKAALGRAGT
ncbi:MAG: response regulator [Gemmatimonadales bacterium]